MENLEYSLSVIYRENEKSVQGSLSIFYINQTITRLCPVISLTDFENSHCSEKGSEFVVPVVSGVKVGLFFLDKASYISEKCPSLIIGEIRNSILHHLDHLRRDSVYFSHFRLICRDRWERLFSLFF